MEPNLEKIKVFLEEYLKFLEEYEEGVDEPDIEYKKELKETILEL